MFDVKEGDVVRRMLAGVVPHDLIVSKVENGIIECGAWTFDQATGAEIDEDLNFGPPPKMTGSLLTEILEKKNES